MKEVKTSKRNLTRTHALRLGALLAALCLHASALAQNIILKVSDKKNPDPVPAEQVDEWLAAAENGDWDLMTEFASAYLHQSGCGKLPYGHRCRAMAAKPDAGRKFLFEIINTPVDPKDVPPYAGKHRYIPPKISDISWLQEEYAASRLQEAQSRKGEVRPDPEDPACKDYIKYISLAAENGRACAAEKAGYAYSLGKCIEKNEEKKAYFFNLSFACPRI